MRIFGAIGFAAALRGRTLRGIGALAATIPERSNSAVGDA